MAAIEVEAVLVSVLPARPRARLSDEQITDDAKGFLGTLFGLRAYVGLRSEYNVLAKLARQAGLAGVV